MNNEVKGTCSGCPNTFREGDVAYGREVLKVESDSVVVLPLDYMYCEGCASTVLNMTSTEIAGAKVELEEHIANCSILP